MIYKRHCRVKLLHCRQALCSAREKEDYEDVAELLRTEANMVRLDCFLTTCAIALVINVGAASAAGHGGGWHGGGKYGVGKYGVGNWGRYGYGGYGYGGYGVLYYGTPQYYTESAVDGPASQPLGPVVPASFVLGCKYSQEIKTVPSEDGGTRQITITRC